MADPALLISVVSLRVVWGSAPEGFISLFEGCGSPPGPASLQLEPVGENAQGLVDSLFSEFPGGVGAGWEPRHPALSTTSLTFCS